MAVLSQGGRGEVREELLGEGDTQGHLGDVNLSSGMLPTPGGSVLCFLNQTVTCSVREAKYYIWATPCPNLGFAKASGLDPEWAEEVKLGVIFLWGCIEVEVRDERSRMGLEGWAHHWGECSLLRPTELPEQTSLAFVPSS